MPTGKEMLVNTLMAQLIRHLPPEVVDNVEKVAQTVMDAKAQMDRIEAKLDAIISDPIGPPFHGRISGNAAPRIQPNGSSAE